MKVLNLWYSQTGNTAKVASAIAEAAVAAGHEVDAVDVAGEPDRAIDLLAYDIAFAGSGVYAFLAGKPVMEYLGRLLGEQRRAGEVKPKAPRRPGKRAVVYCTYGGPHTGVNEAVPAVKWLGQIFDHLGIEVVAEWYVVGEFHGSAAEMSVKGRLGDIRGRPNEADLRAIAEQVKGILGV